ncbi:MAG: flavodoxin [Clostridium sp.]
MKIIFWSGTGNTETMAKLIAKGIEETGVEAELINISDETVDILNSEDVVVLGCPSMGDEELEQCEFLPFFDNTKNELSGKKVALFGSYGWGDGAWIRNWEEEVTSLGATVLLEPLKVNYTPEGETVEECIQYGREISRLSK